MLSVLLLTYLDLLLQLVLGQIALLFGLRDRIVGALLDVLGLHVGLGLELLQAILEVSDELVSLLYLDLFLLLDFVQRNLQVLDDLFALLLSLSKQSNNNNKSSFGLLIFHSTM